MAYLAERFPEELLSSLSGYPQNKISWPMPPSICGAHPIPNDILTIRRYHRPIIQHISPSRETGVTAPESAQHRSDH